MNRKLKYILPLIFLLGFKYSFGQNNKLLEETNYLIENKNSKGVKYPKMKNDSVLLITNKLIDKVEKSNCQECLSKLYLFKGNLFGIDKGLKYYQKSLLVAKANNLNECIANTAEIIGTAYTRLHEEDSSKKYYSISLEFYKKINNINKLFDLNLMIAGRALGRNNYEISNKHFEDCYELKNYTGKYYCSMLGQYADLLDRMKNLQKADKMINEAIQCSDNTKGKSEMFIRQRLLFNYKYQKNKDSAIVELEKLAIQNKNIKYYTAGTYNMIADRSFELKDYSNAEKYYEKSLNISKENESFTMFSIYEDYTQVLDTLKKYEKAYHILKEYSLKKDKFDKEKLLSKVDELNEKYENEKKQKEIELLNKEKQLNKSLLTEKESELKLLSLQDISKQKDIELLNKNKKLAKAEFENLASEKEKEKNKFEKQNIEKQAVIEKEKFQKLLLLLVSISVLAIAFGIYRSLQKNKEKNKIISAQKTIVEQQKHLVEEKQKEIIESITYAKRLQEAILPPQVFLNKYIPNNFILYKPKDLVAGDFYWAEQINDLFFIAAADSTGHGVPGAMVSVVCSNALNRTVKEFNLTETGEILDKTRELVLETFEKSTNEVKDGMDISLLCIDTSKKQIFWSGANNPLWYFQENKLKEIKADKQPIGKTEYPKPFTTHSIEYIVNTTFYLFTDGFADQFGGPKGKKFKYKQFSDLLVTNINLPQQQQAETIDKAFEDWKGNLEQVDDVCVIGIKI